MILEFIETQQLEILLTPYEVAVMMKKAVYGPTRWDHRRR